MVKRLIEWLENGFAPYIITALFLVIAGLAIFAGVQTWRLHSAQVGVATAGARETVLTANADTARKNTAACDAAVTAQGQQIDGLAAAGDAKNQQNTNRAAKTFARPLAPEPGSEDARGMNEWLAKVLQ